MAKAVTMPRLGLSMVEGTVTEWRVKPGDPVARGQVILLIESEKAEVEVEAFDDGVLAAIYVEPGKSVPIGELLGAIALPDEPFDADAFARSFVPERGGAPATNTAPRPSPPPAAGGGKAAPEGPRVAPASRALAKRLGIDLARVRGTGPGGRVLPEDVERTASALIAVNGTRLTATATGSGPAVLLINGFAVDASGWRRQTDDLASDHRVVAWDPRGIGDSLPCEAPLSIGTLMEDAVALLRHFDCGRTVVVGASMGAAVALEITLAHPELVAALLLLSPVLERDARLEAILGSWAGIEDAAPRAQVMLPWILGREALADPVRREAAAAALRAMCRRIAASALEQHRAALVDWLGSRGQDLGAIRAPVHVLVGDDDLVAPPPVASSLAGRIPGARLERFPGAGHALMIERADSVNRLVRELARSNPAT